MTYAKAQIILVVLLFKTNFVVMLKIFGILTQSHGFSYKKNIIKQDLILNIIIWPKYIDEIQKYHLNAQITKKSQIQCRIPLNSLLTSVRCETAPRVWRLVDRVLCRRHTQGDQLALA